MTDDLIRRSAKENASLAADLRCKDGSLPRARCEARAESYSASLRLPGVRKQIAAVETRGRENHSLDNKPTLQQLRLSEARLFEAAERDNER